MTGFPEGFRRYAVGLLKQLIEIGHRRKSHIIANGKDGIVGILQLEGSLLQTDLIQIFRHGVAGVLAETAAEVGFVEMEGL